ncbi:Holliday junction branch migration protein RuvA [Candidatus Uhrbacteria bacterium]|nr:Holliday junction branch migration protein RuvA [Candidatus Uhrbacteria bacterium]
MLALLEGTIAIREEDSVVLLVSGVGYRVFTSRGVGETGETARLYLAEVIREDRYDLYGFATREELAFFHRLIAIDGVGPKMAQKILASGSESMLRARIAKGDVAFLTSISGVGKKTAQKIVLELKGVLVEETGEVAPGDGELVEALLGLGYHRSDVTAVLPSIEGERTEDRLKHALQLLGKTR